MDKKKKSDNKNINYNTEDVTECGEFISSYFEWITLDQQRKKSEEMDKMTKDK